MGLSSIENIKTFRLVSQSQERRRQKSNGYFQGDIKASLQCARRGSKIELLIYIKAEIRKKKSELLHYSDN